MHVYLNFPGNAAEAFEFYRSLFGGELSSHVRFRDMPMEGVDIPEADQDKAMHIALPIGEDNVLMPSDALESLGEQLQRGNNVYVSVHPDTREDADRIFKGSRPAARSRADRRPGLGRLLRRLYRQVRHQMDGEPPLSGNRVRLRAASKVLRRSDTVDGPEGRVGRQYGR